MADQGGCRDVTRGRQLSHGAGADSKRLDNSNTPFVCVGREVPADRRQIGFARAQGVAHGVMDCPRMGDKRVRYGPIADPATHTLGPDQSPCLELPQRHGRRNARHVAACGAIGHAQGRIAKKGRQQVQPARMCQNPHRAPKGGSQIRRFHQGSRHSTRLNVWNRTTGGSNFQRIFAAVQATRFRQRATGEGRRTLFPGCRRSGRAPCRNHGANTASNETRSGLGGRAAPEAMAALSSAAESASYHQ